MKYYINKFTNQVYTEKEILKFPFSSNTMLCEEITEGEYYTHKNILPKKWCVKDCREIADWTSALFGCSKHVFTNSYLHVDMEKFTYEMFNKCYHFKPIVREGYVELTIEQWRELLPNFYPIEVGDKINTYKVVGVNHNGVLLNDNENYYTWYDVLYHLETGNWEMINDNDSMKTYTINDLSTNPKLFVRCNTINEWNKLKNLCVYGRPTTDYYGPAYYNFALSVWNSKLYNTDIGIEYSQVIFENEIIGYIAPCDLWGGEVKEGSVFKEDPKSPNNYIYNNNDCFSVPKEVVIQWKSIIDDKPLIIKNGVKTNFHPNYVEINGNRINKNLFLRLYEIKKDFCHGVNVGLYKNIETVSIGEYEFTKEEIEQISNYYKKTK